LTYICNVKLITPKCNRKRRAIEYMVGDNGCFNCTSHKPNNAGYSQVYIGGRKILIHRYVYEIFNGEIKSNLIVRHKCDNPSCINPKHLEVGTYLDNSNDCIIRGRKKRGELSVLSKIKDIEVLEIINSNDIYVNIANKYKISVAMVSYIKNGKRRKNKII